MNLQLTFFDAQPDASELADYHSVLVTLRDGDSFVFVRNANRAWEMPGGRRDPGETWEQTAHREVFEEAGATCTALELIGFYILPSGSRTLVATAKVDTLAAIPAGFETLEIMKSKEIPENLSFADNVYTDILNFLRKR